LQRELDVPHTGIAEHHGETVEFPGFAIDLNSTAIPPIDLGLNSWFGLVSIHGRDSEFGSHGPYKIFHDCVFAFKSLILDLAINAFGSEGYS
jgi:hypothetical protein